MPISVWPILARLERPKPRKMSPMPQIAKLTIRSPMTTPMTALPSQLAEAVRIPRSIEPHSCRDGFRSLPALNAPERPRSDAYHKDGGGRSQHAGPAASRRARTARRPGACHFRLVTAGGARGRAAERGRTMAKTDRRPLVAGNWKMNGLRKSSHELLRITQGAVKLPRNIDLVVCPPATLVANFSGLARGSRVRIGAQDCHPEPSGAYTGDISAEMLADAGAAMVIVGHSEPRSYHKETDAQVRVKTLAAWRAGMTAIVCIGETRAEREMRQTLEVVARQLGASLPETARGENLVIAYEPVWAIGTGLTPTTADIAEVHNLIRRKLTDRYRDAGEGMRILYGGSVKPSNAQELMHVADVDGALVGGASLKADEFLAIASVYGQQFRNIG